ncbi:hypothetical protein [Ralstonia mannitolilytica]|uniref:hypothetical protein n=1 Tax=Ralstonia mannitolilytica TaxID=105219 RepID=UPI00292F5746|nr:hypothetical protein [Ralstonia mannitolilytica]
MTISKIKIKLGAIEVEYEGSETFLKEELPSLLSAVSDLYEKSQLEGAEQRKWDGVSPASSIKDGEGASKPTLQSTTNTIAARLQVKTGPDLVLAAAIRLTLAEGLHTFSRQRLLDEIRSATQYFRATHLNNLTRTLHSLVKDGKFNEPSKGQYALTASAQQELEARLA